MAVCRVLTFPANGFIILPLYNKETPTMKLTATSKQSFIKMLYLGLSGQGKSTSLVPLGIPDYLGNPGYELRVLDFDSKFEEVVRATLARMLKDKIISQEQHDKALTENYDICVCTENKGIVSIREGKRTNKTIGVETATAWNTAVKQLEKWNNSWTNRTILVIDSFTHATKAITNYSQELSGKLNQTLEWRDYQGPQQLAENLMYLAADLPTHAIVTAHQDALVIEKPTTQVDDKGNLITDVVDVVMAPISVGKAGRVSLPSKMNHLLVAASEGKGGAEKRYIFTVPKVGVTTKTPYFGLCEERYDLDKGLVKYFALSRDNVKT